MNFRNRKSSGLFWLVLITVLALALSACGGSENESNGTSEEGSGAVSEAENGEASEVESGGSESAAETGGSSGPRSLSDPCSLLDTADVDAILGGSSVPSSNVSEAEQFYICTWIEPNSGASLLINIKGRGSAGEDWANQAVTTQASAVQNNEEISGLGLKAILHENNGDYSLYWNKENAYVVNLTTVGDTNATRDSVLDLGEKIDSGF